MKILDRIRERRKRSEQYFIDDIILKQCRHCHWFRNVETGWCKCQSSQCTPTNPKSFQIKDPDMILEEIKWEQ